MAFELDMSEKTADFLTQVRVKKSLIQHTLTAKNPDGETMEAKEDLDVCM